VEAQEAYACEQILGLCHNVTRATKTKRKPWHWNKVHQTAFDNVKTTIAKDVVLAHSNYSQGFESYLIVLSFN
jgi:hypothetical protein